MVKTVDSTGTARAITAEVVVGPGNVRRTLVSRVVIGADGVRRSTSSGLAVSVTPKYLSGSTGRETTTAFIVGTANAAVVGGKAPFTYLWTATDGFSPTAATAPSATFVSPSLAPGDSAEGTAQVVVTDSNGTTSTSNTINLFASNYGRDLR